MEYVVYSQGTPVKSERKGRDNRNEFEANIVEIGKIDVPPGKCPIERARERFGIGFPMVSAVNGYTEEGKVRPYLQ